MNFYGHAVVAAETVSPDAAFVLGAMLPDLVAMTGGASPLIVDEVAAEARHRIEAGVRQHVRVDDAFHALPAFLDLLESGRERFVAAGLRRGVARAVAHVGIELVLDGELARAARARASYRAALGVARDCLSPGSLLSGIARVAGGPLPDAYGDDAFVLARIAGVLSRRPRLTLTSPDFALLQPDFVGFADEIRQRAAELIEPLVR